VLIVDDEPVSRDVLAGLLFREGYNLVFANNGKELLANIKTLNPDVILLDVMMPEMDGFEVCRRLKANEKWRHVPIILITVLDSKKDLARGLDAGADDFLPKPVNDIELRARVRSMLRIKKQYDRLEAALSLREDMTHMIVHDIRTPLTAITGYSGLLLRRAKVSAEERKQLKTIHTQSRRLNSFLNDMLIMAKMEAEQLILNRTPVDINQLVQQVEESHRAIAWSNKIALTIDLPSSSKETLLDANLFERVLDNLISNALKFSPPRTTVTVRVTYPEADDFYLRIQVLDQGPGVAEEDYDRIFDKFAVAASKQKPALQYGLGLAFCKMVVEAHGGRIYVKANQPEGAIFTVEI
jgi:signal transduction histidine kinase